MDVAVVELELDAAVLDGSDKSYRLYTTPLHRVVYLPSRTSFGVDLTFSFISDVRC